MDETRLFNTFTDYYDQLTDSKLTEGCIGCSDPDEVKMVNVGIATALTINKIMEEK
jgi:hypothetical protein